MNSNNRNRSGWARLILSKYCLFVYILFAIFCIRARFLFSCAKTASISDGVPSHSIGFGSVFWTMLTLIVDWVCFGVSVFILSSSSRRLSNSFTVASFTFASAAHCVSSAVKSSPMTTAFVPGKKETQVRTMRMSFSRFRRLDENKTTTLLFVFEFLTMKSPQNISLSSRY